MPLELPNIDAISLDSASLAIIEDTRQLARKVNEFRPLSEPTLSELRRRLMTEEVYHSNAIEGSTLSLRETAEVLATGELYLVKQREAQEALNLMHAIRHVEGMRSKPGAVSDLEGFLETHRLILASVNDAEAGHLRNHSVMIRGAKYQPPDADVVDTLMAQFLDWLSQSESADPLVRAAWAHWTLARIHPFGDGNGRIARLWQNLILFQGNFTAALIRSTERKEYYECLQLADEGEFNPFVQFVARCCQLTLREYLNAQQAVDELKDWAKSVVGPLGSKSEQELTVQYTNWSIRMQTLRDAFERCAGQLTRASRGQLSFQLIPGTILSRDEWESMWCSPDSGRLRFFQLGCQGPKGQFDLNFEFSHEIVRIKEDPIVLAVSVVRSNPNRNASFTIYHEFLLNPWKLILAPYGFLLFTGTNSVGADLKTSFPDAISVAKEFFDLLCRKFLM